jgi:hypothetical protein
MSEIGLKTNRVPTNKITRRYIRWHFLAVVCKSGTGQKAKTNID